MSRARQLVRRGLATLGLALPCLLGWAQTHGAALNDAQWGERIYKSGLLADSSPLRGVRSDGVRVAGEQAACIQCHRASGLGGAEGNQLIPPIVGSILRAPGLRPLARRGRSNANITRSEHASYTRAAYDTQSFSEAMVAGLHPSGTSLGYLMPRYTMDARSLAQLWAYLDTLSVGQAIGVDDKALHLATIVTADAPTAERDATLAIISSCIAERSPRPMGQTSNALPWKHHIWQLGANPVLWPQELAQHQRKQPVFAVVSGASGGSWTPIHQFCEDQKLPCILPNTASVDDTKASHWSFYFSRGTSLEAAVLAQQLVDTAPPSGWQRIVQRTDGSEAAQLAAKALAKQLRALGISAQLTQRKLDLQADLTLGSTMTEQDALVLWINPGALSLFTNAAAAPRAGRVIFSGELGGLDDAPLAQAWRERAWMLYPYEHADRRNGRILLNTGHWMSRQGLMLEPRLSRLQGNTYSACEVTVRALQTMRTRYSQEFFVELLEAADEAAIATAYPRFTLGPGQRYGSKSASIMQYTAPRYTRLMAIGNPIVPQ
jgi:mono/diheme cytochrome c family protein